MIFSVDRETDTLSQLDEEALSGLGVLERENLQEWTIEHPQILGEELLIISSEYANFKATRDRLDLLALDPTGKLVVVELKRDRADETTDLQAIKYASYCATLTAVDIQKDYRGFWSERFGRDVPPDEVAERFLDFLDEGDEEPVVTEEGWIEFDLDQKPRIILAAGSFGIEITAPVMWLIEEYGMDITCTRIEAYEDGEERILLNSQQIIPVDEAEAYMTKRREKQEQQRSSSRRRAAIKILLDRGVVEPGDTVYFDPDRIPEEAAREWAEDDEYWWATVTGDTGQSDNVRWAFDDEVYSFTGLTKQLLLQLVDRDPDLSVNGYKYWCHPKFDGRTLSDLRQSDVRGDDRAGPTMVPSIPSDR